jgi:hypothetical protein
MNQRATLSFGLLAAWLAAAGGCASLSYPNFWPFPEYERTTYHTPSMRVDAVKQFAERSTHVDSPEQRKLTDQLARQIQIEPDPIVRLAVVQTVAEFKTPMAQQVLEAGLDDDDDAVRIACCQTLGNRGEATSIPKLTAVVRSDSTSDVRLAATAALGKMKSPEAMQGLAVALEDRDPAMQYIAVQSMKSVTGKDYGPNVEAWRQVAAGGTPPPERVPSIAERVRGMSPFK